MPLHEMWVNGNSAHGEFKDRSRGPELDIDGRNWTAVIGFRSVEGVEYRCHRNTTSEEGYWFHFPIPTPVVINSSRTFVREVMVLFTSDRVVSLQAIEVAVGSHVIFNSKRDAGQPSVNGARTRPDEGVNYFKIQLNDEEARASQAVDVGVKFNFGDTGNVTLHGAGVIFESKES